MKIIATIKRSAGNDSVGDMWQETMSFDSSDPIEKVFDWYHFVERQSLLEWKHCSKANIILSIDQGEL